MPRRAKIGQKLKIGHQIVDGRTEVPAPGFAQQREVQGRQARSRHAHEGVAQEIGKVAAGKSVRTNPTATCDCCNVMTRNATTSATKAPIAAPGQESKDQAFGPHSDGEAPSRRAGSSRSSRG